MSRGCAGRGQVVDLRGDGRQAEERAQRGERQEAGEQDVAGLGTEHGVQGAELSGQGAVAVLDALGPAGGAGGEGDHRQVLGPGFRDPRSRAAAVRDRQGQALSQELTPAGEVAAGDQGRTDMAAAPAQGPARHMCQRLPDEDAGGDLVQAAPHLGPRLDQHGNGPDRGQGVYGRHELADVPRHDHRFVAASHSGRPESAGGAAAAVQQLRRRHLPRGQGTGTADQHGGSRPLGQPGQSGDEAVGCGGHRCPRRKSRMWTPSSSPASSITRWPARGKRWTTACGWRRVHSSRTSGVKTGSRMPQPMNIGSRPRSSAPSEG